MKTVENFLLEKEHTPVYLCAYGSVVYGVATEKSDKDYIAVANNTDQISDAESKIDVNIYNQVDFENKIKNHDIDALEAIFCPKEFRIKDCNFEFELNLSRLRESISSKSSHSFVKARKKLRFGEPYVGKKSMWHSFRIILFGTQIAKFGKIIDFAAANYLYEDIVLNDNSDEEYYKNKYSKHINELMTEFRKLAPK